MSPPPLLTLLQRVLPRATAFRWGVTLYPPYLGAGIVCTHVSPALDRIEVELRSHTWNRNFVGTHFGGSLYSMCDPFYMLLLIEQLGDRCVVWDKAATIRYVRPGRGTVKAAFHVEPERLAAIVSRLDAGARSVEEVFSVAVVDDQGKVVAEIDKTVYIRRKDLPGQATT